MKQPLSIKKVVLLLMFTISLSSCQTDSNTSNVNDPTTTKPAKTKEKDNKEEEIRNNNIHILINRLKQQCFQSHRGEVILQMEISEQGEVVKHTFIKAKQNINEKLDAAILCGKDIIKEMKRKFGEIKNMTGGNTKPKNETYTFPL